MSTFEMSYSSRKYSSELGLKCSQYMRLIQPVQYSSYRRL